MTHHSLPLDEAASNNRSSRSRTDLFFEIPYFQEFCLSRTRNFFQKSTKNHQDKFRGAAPRTPSLRGCAPPTHQGFVCLFVGAKCLAAVVLDNLDRALRFD